MNYTLEMHSAIHVAVHLKIHDLVLSFNSCFVLMAMYLNKASSYNDHIMLYTTINYATF